MSSMSIESSSMSIVSTMSIESSTMSIVSSMRVGSGESLNMTTSSADASGGVVSVTDGDR